MNREFGKIVDGVFSFAPNTVVFNNRIWINPSAEKYELLGYLPVVWDKPEGTAYNGEFKENDGKIVAQYGEAEAEAEDIETKVAELENVLQELILAQWGDEENV